MPNWHYYAVDKIEGRLLNRFLDFDPKYFIPLQNVLYTDKKYALKD